MKTRRDSLVLNQTVYTIAQAAERVSSTTQTLLLYEKHGFVQPLRRAKSRLYRDADIRLLRCIRHMIHSQKLSIEALKKLFLYAPCWEIRACDEEFRIDCPAFEGNDASRQTDSETVYAGL